MCVCLFGEMGEIMFIALFFLLLCFFPTELNRAQEQVWKSEQTAVKRVKTRSHAGDTTQAEQQS